MKKNPDLEMIDKNYEHLFNEEKKKSIPKKDQLRNLPLKQKLALIEKFNLKPNEFLNKTECNILKFEKQLFIPDQIKMTNLKKLLHKNVSKVNKWIKHSLKGTYQHEFDYFMQNDKTIVDKNSLQYQQLLDEQRAREILAQKLEASKGGFIDPNMRAIDLTHRKIIGDILNKYQVKNHLVIPIYNEKRDQMDIKLQDIEKLQEEILKEHEEIEQKLRQLKERKFNKWKLLNQEFKKKQATMAQAYSPSPGISPSLSPKIQSPRGKMFPQSNNINQSPKNSNNNQTTRTISPNNTTANQFTSNGRVGQKFREYLMEKFEQKRNEELIRNLDEELYNQCKMLKDVDKDLDEFQYYMVKKQNGDTTYEHDPLLPDELYIKSGKKKHFSKNIVLWKQKEMYEDRHGDWSTTFKKQKLLQNM